MTVNVLLVDDSDAMRKAAANLLKGDPGIELLGEAADFRHMIQSVADLRPQIVVMDLHMPDEKEMSIADIKSHLRGTQVLAMSLWTDDETKTLAAKFGAIMLLDKTKLFTDLLPAVRRCEVNLDKEKFRSRGA
jgi:DNA-binding NarL/FixJ family response regulator